MKEPNDVEDINQQASVLMKSGIALLNENTPASLKQAIGHFDQAVVLRQNLPLDADPFFRYGLAAGWMNRGDTLTRLGSVEDLAEALSSYDGALHVLQGLPLDANPLFRRRLAIAWVNRGLALQARNNEPALLEAGRCFETAIAVLQDGNAAEIGDRDYLLAVAWINWGNVLVQGQTIEAVMHAQTMAKQAMALAAQTSSHNLTMLEVDLKARRILCQAIAQLLARPGQTSGALKELIDEATDAVDDGIALARSWEKQGLEQFRPLVKGLFNFGACAYQTFQSHFLNEFLMENSDLVEENG